MRFEFVPDPQRLRPSMNVSFRAAHVKGEEVTLDALIDTGADKCFIDADFCEPLGLKLKKGALEKVNGGAITGYYHDVIYQTELEHPAIQVKALFSENLHATTGFYAIMGSHGFLDKFTIFVNAKERFMEVEKI